MKSPLRTLGAIARFIEEKTGWRVVRSLETPGALPEATELDYQTIRSVRAYTMTSVERQWALINAVRFAVRAPIAGNIVECGVWRGGAVDDFFAAQAAPILLSRIDETGRIGVKPSGAGAP